LSLSVTSQRRHHSPAHGGDIISAGKQDSIDSSMNSLRDAIPGRSIPLASSVWMKNALHGFKPEHLEYLPMSYLMGPNEGWIALKRNVLALAVFERLQLDVAEMAIRELANMLSSGLVREAVRIFTEPAWRIRDLLLPHLKNVAASRREDFCTTSKCLASSGPIHVPSIDVVLGCI
jgi:hypothetical protein